MICNNCGKSISTHANYCRFCGVEIGVISNNLHVFKVHRYGGFLLRLLAYIFDTEIIIILFAVTFALVGETTYDAYLNNRFIEIIIYIIYNTLCLSIWSTTPGKALFGMNVVNEENHAHLTFSESLKRSSYQILSTLFFGSGYWNMSSDPQKQAFHDKKAHTVVVKNTNSIIFPIVILVGVTTLLLYLIYSGSQ